MTLSIRHALLAMLLVFSSGVHADEAGAQLAQKVFERSDGKDSTSQLTMTLTEAGRNPRVRKMISYQMRHKPGELAVLTRFTDPTDIAGTGLLTLDHINADTDQWIYLPALDRVRRIIKVLGMVNTAPDFYDHPKVINGCSELFAEIWGPDDGIGARSAVGMGPLPGNIAVEIEAIFELH